MDVVSRDIKEGSFKRVYLLYGEESYLKNYYKIKLLKAAVSQFESMNTSFFSGKNIDIKAVIDIAETLPFMSPRRVILLEQSGFFKDAPEEDFIKYIKEGVPEETVFIFVESEIDKRGRLYKAAASYDRAIELKTPEEAVLKNWIGKLFTDNGKKIRLSTFSLFRKTIGADSESIKALGKDKERKKKSGSLMESVKNEALKLISYVGDRDIIEDRDVLSICTINHADSVFDMVDAVCRGDEERALELYYEMVELNEPPLKILYLIAREFRLLLKAKELGVSGNRGQAVSGLLGVPPFRVKQYLENSSKFAREELETAIDDCLYAEEAVKTGKMGDRLSVELIIVRYSAGRIGYRRLS